MKAEMAAAFTRRALLLAFPGAVRLLDGQQVVWVPNEATDAWRASLVQQKATAGTLAQAEFVDKVNRFSALFNTFILKMGSGMFDLKLWKKVVEAFHELEPTTCHRPVCRCN